MPLPTLLVAVISIFIRILFLANVCLVSASIRDSRQLEFLVKIDSFERRLRWAARVPPAQPYSFCTWPGSGMGAERFSVTRSTAHDPAIATALSCHASFTHQPSVIPATKRRLLCRREGSVKSLSRGRLALSPRIQRIRRKWKLPLHKIHSISTCGIYSSLSAFFSL